MLDNLIYNFVSFLAGVGAPAETPSELPGTSLVFPCPRCNKSNTRVSVSSHFQTLRNMYHMIHFCFIPEVYSRGFLVDTLNGDILYVCQKSSER